MMNEYQWHGPAMTMPAPVPRLGSRLVAAGGAGVAALLTLVGSFLPLYTVSGLIDGQKVVLSITSWGFDLPIRERYGTTPITGSLLAFATVVLLTAAVLCWVAASRSTRPGTVRAAVVAAVGGAAFLTGGVWAIVTQVVSHARGFQPPRGTEEAAAFEEGTGAGLWLLVAGTVVALVAMVLALRRDPQSVTRSPATSNPTRWRTS